MWGFFICCPQHLLLSQAPIYAVVSLLFCRGSAVLLLRSHIFSAEVSQHCCWEITENLLKEVLLLLSIWSSCRVNAFSLSWLFPKICKLWIIYHSHIIPTNPQFNHHVRTYLSSITCKFAAAFDKWQTYNIVTIWNYTLHNHVSLTSSNRAGNR